MYLSQAIVGFDASDVLKNISVPTLILHGADDTIFPPEVAQEMAEKIKNAELSFMTDTNHISVINDPKKVKNGLSEFVEKVYD